MSFAGSGGGVLALVTPAALARSRPGLRSVRIPTAAARPTNRSISAATVRRSPLKSRCGINRKRLIQPIVTSTVSRAVFATSVRPYPVVQSWLTLSSSENARITPVDASTTKDTTAMVEKRRTSGSRSAPSRSASTSETSPPSQNDAAATCSRSTGTWSGDRPASSACPASVGSGSSASAAYDSEPLECRVQRRERREQRTGRGDTDGDRRHRSEPRR